MTKAPRPLDRLAVVLMAILSFSWGCNQIAAKIAFADFAPVTQSALRSGIGSLNSARLCLARETRSLSPRRDAACRASCRPLVRRRIHRAFRRGADHDGGQRDRLSVHGAVFRGARRPGFLPAERPRPRQWLGMALAFCGVAAGLYRSVEGARLAGDLLRAVRRRPRARRPSSSRRPDCARSTRPRCCSTRPLSRR